MSDGVCYYISDSNTIYAFPNLQCSDGSSFPNVSNQTRETYRLIGGRYVLTRSDWVGTNYQDLSSYVAHVWHGDSYYLDINSLILPATLLMICFFYIIYKWFIRLRG